MDNETLDKMIRGKNINFLIGSGASTPLYPTLNIKNANFTIEDILSHDKLSEDARTYMYIYFFMKCIEPMLNESPCANLDISDVHKNYKKFIESLYNFLQTESNEKPKRINIFTTNYDMLFESTFDSLLRTCPFIYFNDGSRGFINKYVGIDNYNLNISHSGYTDNYKKEIPTINLFKLHGSISWLERDEHIIIDNTYQIFHTVHKSILNLNKKAPYTYESIYDYMNSDSLSRDSLLKVIETLNHRVETLEIIPSTLLKNIGSEIKHLPIIYPSKEKFYKTITGQYHYQIIRSLNYELEKPQTVLIVFGFSFADEHICDIFRRSLSNPELQVIIISYSSDGQKELKNKFGAYKNIIFLPEKFEGKKGDWQYLLPLLGDSNEQ